MAEVYTGYHEIDPRTVALIILSELLDFLEAEQVAAVNARITGGRKIDANTDYLHGEINGMGRAIDRLRFIRETYDGMAEIMNPDPTTETGL